MFKLALATALLAALFAAAPSTAAAGPLSAKKERPVHLAEVAPLRGTMGQVSARAEFSPAVGFGLAAVFERAATASPERADFQDTDEAYAIEAVWYPFGLLQLPFLMATGLRRETVVIGRESLRDTRTWARVRAEDATDTWRNVDTYLATTQAVGWRVLAGGLFTAALRIERDEVVARHSQTRQDDVQSASAPLETSGRAPVLVRLTLHAGLYLH